MKIIKLTNINRILKKELQILNISFEKSLAKTRLHNKSSNTYQDFLVKGK